MPHILRESRGICLQDADYKIYNTTNPAKRIKKLFFDLLIDAEFDQKYIGDVMENVVEDGYFDGEDCYFSNTEAWVDFKDLYSTRVVLTVVD